MRNAFLSLSPKVKNALAINPAQKEHQMASIGFIGLGNMGLPMASNLQNAGYTVSGFDVTETARKAAHSAGLGLATGNADAALNADIVVLMLPNGTTWIQV